MAPRGHLHFHPTSDNYCEDFATADIWRKAHFIHEMTHVWQVQAKGKWWLVLNRMPWERYEYSLRPGWALEKYGIEQQAEIVRHWFMARRGNPAPDAPPLHVLDAIVPYQQRTSYSRP